MSLVDDIDVARKIRFSGNEEKMKELITLADEALVVYCSYTNHREGFIPWTALDSNEFVRAYRNASPNLRKILFNHFVEQDIDIRVANFSGEYYFEFLPPVVPDIYKNGISMFKQSLNQT